MALSLKKYLASALKWLIPFALLEVLLVVLRLTESAEAELFAMVTMVSVFCLLLPGGYFLTMFFVYRKRCKSFSPTEGVIVNWQAGFYRYTGSVIVNVDGKEYSTSAYFSQEECKELVGKAISYAIIDETLFIYEIKE